jgi:hypothetical protein
VKLKFISIFLFSLLVSPLSVIILLVNTQVAFGNDSEGGWGLTGGLVFKKNDAINMLSEDLFLSPELVRVSYTYENTTSEDVDILVAFPIPSPKRLNPEWDGHHSFEAYIESLNFKTWVDNKPVDWWPYFGNSTPWGDKCRELWNQRNSIYDKEGYCFKSRSGKIKFDNSDCNTSELVLNDNLKAKISSIQKLEKQYSCKVEPTIQSIDPYFEAEDYVSILRNQKFPAKSITKVVHEYKPDISVYVPMFSILDMPDALNSLHILKEKDEEFLDMREQQIVAELDCVNKKDALDILDGWEKTLREKYPEGNFSHSDHWFSTRVLSYILKTGKNWNGRIGKFRMEVNTGNTEAILRPSSIDACFEGLRRVSNSTYIFEAEDYLPNSNISITFFNWPQDY